jgi:hypothetical protein
MLTPSPESLTAPGLKVGRALLASNSGAEMVGSRKRTCGSHMWADDRVIVDIFEGVAEVSGRLRSVWQ